MALLRYVSINPSRFIDSVTGDWLRYSCFYFNWLLIVLNGLGFSDNKLTEFLMLLLIRYSSLIFADLLVFVLAGESLFLRDPSDKMY